VEIFRIPEVDLSRKWICIFCVIQMLGSMLGSMPEMVQQVEIPFFTVIIIRPIIIIIVIIIKERHERLKADTHYPCSRPVFTAVHGRQYTMYTGRKHG